MFASTRAAGEENYRPPLANELFENRENFSATVERFPACAPLVTKFRRLMGSQEFSIERELRAVQDEADNYPRFHQQLAAIRFYLQHIVWECGVEWQAGSREATNYAELLADLERWQLDHGEPVCVVTFNYDTMLEAAAKALLDFSFDELSDYVEREDFKFIKPHGSVNWTRPVPVPLNTPVFVNEDEARHHLIRTAPHQKFRDFEIRGPNASQQDRHPNRKAIHLPAIQSL